MALITVGPDSIFPLPFLLDADDGLIVLEGTSISGSGDTMIAAIDSNQTITVNGSIYHSGFVGLLLGNFPSDLNNSIVVGSSGALVSSGAAVLVQSGDTSVINNGLITGSEAAIRTTGENFNLVNSGTIVGWSDGVTAVGNGNMTLTNTGTITSLSSRPGNNNNCSVQSGGGDDKITNKGALYGNVDLGAGNDIHDGNGGRTAGWIWGNSGNDRLAGGANYDLIFGGVGADRITGRGGRDLLFGDDQNTQPFAAGADTFDYNSILDSGTTATTRDRIHDFNNGNDRIDLFDIDANTAVAGNQAFSLLARGTASSAVGTGKIGWYFIDSATNANDRTILRINTDADAAIEMTIELVGLKPLSSLAGVDFIF